MRRMGAKKPPLPRRGPGSDAVGLTVLLRRAAFVERMKFDAIILFTALWLVLVYAPVTHWVWGGGWDAADGRDRSRGRHHGHAVAFGVWRGGLRRSQRDEYPPQLLVQVECVGFTLLWSGVVSVLIILLVKKTVGLRVGEVAETTGLD